MADDYPDIGVLREWARDPGNAEPCATFPADPERVSGPGLYAWHGDDVASTLIGNVLGGCSLAPLFVDQAGADSPRTRRASGATLKSNITRHHLRGTTQASTFRRSLAAVLWNDLDLRCERPKVLDRDSNARLSNWMLEHLSVATLPIADRSLLWLIARDVVDFVDPVMNLRPWGMNTPARRRLRKLRSRHFSLATADVERIDRLMNLHAFAAAQDSGQEFLKRRLEHEGRRFSEGFEKSRTARR